MQKINLNKNVNVMISDYETMFKNAVVISYNEDYIEIPGIVIFARKKEKQSFINKLLNPGMEIIEIQLEIFEQMKEALKAHEIENYVISFESRTKPVKTVLVNVQALKNSFVFAKIDNDTITVNDYVFTNNEMEFHGDGMFTSKKVYFIGFEEMSKIKAIIEN